MSEEHEIRDIREQYFCWYDRKIFERIKNGIGVIGFAVYNAYIFFSNGRTGKTFVSLRKIADLLDINKDTVANYKKKLVEHGLISVAPGAHGTADVISILSLKAKITVLPDRTAQKESVRTDGGGCPNQSDKVSGLPLANYTQQLKKETYQEEDISTGESRAFFDKIRALLRRTKKIA